MTCFPKVRPCYVGNFQLLNRYPPLDHQAGDFARAGAHGGNYAGEPFISGIGGLLPMALCGRTSL